MELSPKMYHWFVRPKWFTSRYNNTLKSLLKDFDFYNKKVLDFGCGVGSSSSIFNPRNYIGVDCDAKRISYARRLYTDYRFEIAIDNNLFFSDKSIDFILIMAVLHHISPQETSTYIKEFSRVIKPNGKILVIEPCNFKKTPITNWYMNCFDKGKYISNEEDYQNMFNNHSYETQTLKRFKKCLYNELFFIATPK